MFKSVCILCLSYILFGIPLVAHEYLNGFGYVISFISGGLGYLSLILAEQHGVNKNGL